jgi:deoxycytidine triphosphate deaminase
MGVLPTIQLHRLISEERLIVEPFELREKQVPPATIDLTLRGRVLKYKLDSYLIGEEITEEKKGYEEIENGIYRLPPGNSAIFQIYEKLGLPPNIAGLVIPRSSITRLGIVIQPTYLNPGYMGYCPVTVVNHAPFEVKIPFKNGRSPRFLQVMFFELTSIPHRKYGEGIDEKYQKEEGMHSLINQDYDIYEILAPLAEIAEKYE